MISRMLITQSTDVVPIFPGYRYVQLLAGDISWKVDSGNWYNTWYTLSMFESANCTGPDLCIGKTVLASSSATGGYAATNAVDGNDLTRWSTPSQATQSWFSVDLGAKYRIRSISFKPYAQPYHPKSIYLKYSNTAITYPMPVTGDRIYTTNVPGQLQVFHNLTVPEV
jgi:hypothetical protein